MWAELARKRWRVDRVPSHLTIPVDLFAARSDAAAPYPSLVFPAPPEPNTSDIAKAVSLLRSAERPVIIAGSGVWWSGAEAEFRAFAEHTRIPVFTVTLARGIYSDLQPLAFGYADPSLNRAAARAFVEADVVLVLGKRIDFRLSFGSSRVFAESAKFIQVDIHPAEIGMNRRVEVGICADVKAVIKAMLAEIGDKQWHQEAWANRLTEFRSEWNAWLESAADTGSPIHPSALFAELREAIPENVLYSWDGGDFAHWGRAILPATTPGGWVRLGPLATIGAALPNGLALQMANPDKPVVVITGDGSLGFYIAELDTAVRHNLPIVVIVGNDAGWGLERELQGRDRTVGCELRPTRYDIVMQGFGGDGENITSLAEVRPAIERAFTAHRPYLLNVNVRGVRSPFTRWKLGDG